MKAWIRTEDNTHTGVLKHGHWKNRQNNIALGTIASLGGMSH